MHFKNKLVNHTNNNFKHEKPQKNIPKNFSNKLSKLMDKNSSTGAYDYNKVIDNNNMHGFNKEFEDSDSDNHFFNDEESDFNMEFSSNKKNAIKGYETDLLGTLKVNNMNSMSHTNTVASKIGSFSMLNNYISSMNQKKPVFNEKNYTKQQNSNTNLLSILGNKNPLAAHQSKNTLLSDINSEQYNTSLDFYSNIKPANSNAMSVENISLSKLSPFSKEENEFLGKRSKPSIEKLNFGNRVFKDSTKDHEIYNNTQPTYNNKLPKSINPNFLDSYNISKNSTLYNRKSSDSFIGNMLESNNMDGKSFLDGLDISAIIKNTVSNFNSGK